MDNKNIILLVCCIFLIVSSHVSCRKPPKSTKSPSVSGRVSKIQYSEKSTLTDDLKGVVVAKIGNDVITLGEFEAKFSKEPSYVKMRYNSPQRRLEYLKSMVEFEILAMESQKNGYDQDPHVIQVLKEEMVKQYEKTVLDNLASLSDVTEEDIKKYYDEHINLYVRSDQKRISHLLIKDKEKAKKLLSDLNLKMKANPEKKRKIFMETVGAFSEDHKTKETGGDLGFIPFLQNQEGESEVPAELVSAADKLKERFDMSELILTVEGYHILFVTAVRTGVNRSLDDVKTSIQERLFRKLRHTAKKSYVEKLLKDSNIEIYDDALKQFQDSSEEKKMSGNKDEVKINSQELKLPDLRKNIISGNNLKPVRVLPEKVLNSLKKTGKKQVNTKEVER